MTIEDQIVKGLTMMKNYLDFGQKAHLMFILKKAHSHQAKISKVNIDLTKISALKHLNNS